MEGEFHLGGEDTVGFAALICSRGMKVYPVREGPPGWRFMAAQRSGAVFPLTSLRHGCPLPPKPPANPQGMENNWGSASVQPPD